MHRHEKTHELIKVIVMIFSSKLIKSREEAEIQINK